MITIELVTSAVYTLLGLSALVVVLTQILKNAFNKDEKRWLSHLLSFISALVCNAAVLAIGLWGNIGIYEGFDVNNVMSWLIFAGTTIGCTGVANGLWSYDFMKKILEWIRLLPQPENR